MDSGHLDVGDGQTIYWESCGDPDGKPLVWLHGGPGMPQTERWRRRLTAHGHRAILFHQRGCGLSTPHAADPAVDMSPNTLPALVSDMEELRGYLGVRRWLVAGGAWGSTLALAYALAHPERVTEMVLTAVTTSGPDEIAWRYAELARVFPEEAERFHGGLAWPEVLDDYVRRLGSHDAAVRQEAAERWCAWEQAVLSHEAGPPSAFSGEVSDDLLAFARICAHYFAHSAWLEQGALARSAAEVLAGVPAVLIHGRLDLGSPLRTAWRLAESWESAELDVLEGSGHRFTAAANAALSQALKRFA
ncbi:alpha/beta fold hydrolase [Actinokineospora pegani]|uniref:alpha/beta fold hydrolase n=1 Tax=Actinokineospora pegani TaxID=2654637 RepID=UPI0012E9B2C0|nr:alpha/beta fold hydrolase [Actinokineospora pegani]